MRTLALAQRTYYYKTIDSWEIGETITHIRPGLSGMAKLSLVVEKA